jgi:hypothetical protein
VLAALADLGLAIEKIVEPFCPLQKRSSFVHAMQAEIARIEGKEWFRQEIVVASLHSHGFHDCRWKFALMFFCTCENDQNCELYF